MQIVFKKPTKYAESDFHIAFKIFVEFVSSNAQNLVY